MRRQVWGVVGIFLVVAACTDDGGIASTATTTPATSTTAVAVTSTLAPEDTTTLPPTAVTTTTVADDGALLIEIDQPGDLALLVEGEPVAIGARIAVPRGSIVRVVATLGASDEIHVHGYDVAVEAAAGVTAVLEFAADIPGIFEVELEGAHTLLFELEVS